MYFPFVRGIKIAISGKGGVGKSTIAAVWALLLAQTGRPVYAIDADPDANLAHALGMPESLQKKIRPLAQDDALVEERTGARRGKPGQIFSLSPEVSDIAAQYAVTFNGVGVLVLGAIKKGGAGCACPESTLLKSLVRHLVLRENEAVILDMEAGVEHLGRATASGVDALVIVTEPGSRSFETARHIKKLGDDIGLGKKTFLVLNKARDEAKMRLEAEKTAPGVPVLGTVFFHESFISADEEMKTIFDVEGSARIIEQFTKALNALLSMV